eukprot:scaffold82979_cov63-Phaeocystis_antarctica.AAC.4
MQWRLQWHLACKTDLSGHLIVVVGYIGGVCHLSYSSAQQHTWVRVELVCTIALLLINVTTTTKTTTLAQPAGILALLVVSVTLSLQHNNNQQLCRGCAAHGQLLLAFIDYLTP